MLTEQVKPDKIREREYVKPTTTRLLPVSKQELQLITRLRQICNQGAQVVIVVTVSNGCFNYQE